MINQKAQKAVESAVFSSSFRQPLYSSYCFSKIPGTIEYLLTGEGSPLPSDCYDSGKSEWVILLFLDGFGWTFLEKHLQTSPFLQKMVEQGIASKLTSMFPSTTAAHVTCIHTGLTPGESGIYEWFIYEPEINEVIAPLPFTIAGHKKETLEERVSLKELFPFPTFYEKLSEKGVHSTIIQPEGIAHSAYSRRLTRGAEVVPYESLETGLDLILSERKEGRQYTLLYFPDIDSVYHRKGIGSPEGEQTIRDCLTALDQFIEKLPSNATVLVTADHGMTPTHPKTTYFLNRQVPNIQKNFLLSSKNRPLTPAGSPRDYFLHIEPNKLRETKEILERFIDGKGEIYFTEDLIEKGFFGPMTQRLKERIGNLVILPYKEEAVWWYEKGHFEQNFHAAHGGLTPDEMEIPFLFYRLAAQGKDSGGRGL